MKRVVLVRLPKLHDWGGDMNKQWFIFFSCRNPLTGKMQRFRKYDGLQKCKTEPERRAEAERQLKLYAEKLKTGWTPFTEAENRVIYNDQLQYAAVAEIYGRARLAVKNFGFYGSMFLDAMHGVEPSTVQSYRSKLRIVNTWLQKKGLHEHHICELDNRTVQEFFRFLIETRKISRKTFKDYRLVLLKVFDLAIAEGSVVVSPVHSLPACLRETDMAPRPIQEFDIHSFLTAIDEADAQLGLYIRFEFNCFMRPKEIRHMRVKWIDFAAGTITTPRTVLKTKHDRISVIPQAFLSVLRQKLMNQNREHYVFSRGGVPGPVMLGKNNMRYRFVAIRKALNMPYEYKLYSWKHSGNVRAEQMDIPMVDRMHQNGHTSIRTTEVYTRNRIGRSGNAFKKFEAI